MDNETYIDSNGQELEVEIDSFGFKRYYNSKGQYHRLDGPAIEYPNGNYSWYKNNRRHRIGGPAAKFNRKLYWHFINGKKVKIYYIYG